MIDGDLSSVVPAQLAFLAIYNPLISSDRDSINDQIAFYTSRSTQLRRRAVAAGEDDTEESKDEENQRMRQIGLAQAMLDFARNFSDGSPIDSVGTDKSCIVTHELEKDWWVLASIDLTRLPSSATGQNNADAPSFRYSSRELAPPGLLIQHLRRAHSAFLLHNGPTLDHLYQQIGKSKLCALLDRFWMKFAWTWDILLNGNPTVDIYNGIKLSAGGELGIGVGEEEWGSGERAVLEDLVTGTEGLVDLIVSRFGDPPILGDDIMLSKESKDLSASRGKRRQWLGTDVQPRPSDGVIFSGVGAISKESLAHVSQWMEWIYRYGEGTYGLEDPMATSSRHQRKRRSKIALKDATIQATNSNNSQPIQERSFSPGIPRPIVIANPKPTRGASEQGELQAGDANNSSRGERGSDWPGLGSDTIRKVLTLGYGSAWSLPSMGPSAREGLSDEAKQNDSHGNDQVQRVVLDDKAGTKAQATGRFIIGLRGDINNQSEGPEGKGSSNRRTIQQKTLYMRLLSESESDEADAKLQVVIYIHQPFIYTFLFDPETPSLTRHSLYTAIHSHLTPLHKRLSASTSLETAAVRVSASSTTDRSSRFSPKREHRHPIYELVYDPKSHTVRSSIPNIPDLEALTCSNSSSGPLPWSRTESLAIHHRILNTYLETRSRQHEVEQTSKIGRGWWIVWVRIRDFANSGNPTNKCPDADNPFPEAFVVRKASDYIDAVDYSRSSGGAARFFRDLSGGSTGSTPSSASPSRKETSPGRIVEGLGLDARRYIENLLNLNR